MRFYYLTEDFGMVDVCVFERKTQFEVFRYYLNMSKASH